ncbi:MAG TPA: pyridoxamine 5'-phosphate oxidase family protein [Acidimicrobiia bacterium]|nr:pyridoxamine 5'-phosphate oxidase family protein [Acidimicrobiia bacterium]
MGQGPFHAGELALQRATGEADEAGHNGRIISGELLPSAVGYIARQVMAIAATVDQAGRPWASPLLGPPGSFVAAGLAKLELNRSTARADDPLWADLAGDPRIGLIFLEPVRRRRYRVNGHVVDPAADPLLVVVDEAFGNCPKYIASRELTLRPSAAPDDGAGAATGTALGADERRIIAAADVAFVASAHPTGSLDASHKGGRPGFIEVRDGAVWIPDYYGNSLFNTLGNLWVNPVAGLLFIDFDSGQSLQLTGTTTVDIDAGPEPGGRPASGAAGRSWTLHPTAWRRAPLPAGLEANLLERSPFNP